MSDADDPMDVRNLHLISDSTCHFVTDSPQVRLGAIRTVIDGTTHERQRVEVIGIAESRMTDKRRAYVMARRLG
ncbi:MAG: hypothetical protein H0W83_15845 [Planctomycetes bacterium]|nr:hypothetical protein [Planctomycetota bacterium]